MKEDRKPTVHDARKILQNQVSSPGSSQPGIRILFTPIRQQTKMKAISRQSNPDTILEAFQNQDMTKDEWEKMADQVLTRGVQII